MCVWVDLRLVGDAELNAPFVKVVSAILCKKRICAVYSPREETCDPGFVGMGRRMGDERCQAYKVLV